MADASRRRVLREQLWMLPPVPAQQNGERIDGLVVLLRRHRHRLDPGDSYRGRARPSQSPGATRRACAVAVAVGYGTWIGHSDPPIGRREADIGSLRGCPETGSHHVSAGLGPAPGRTPYAPLARCVDGGTGHRVPQGRSLSRQQTPGGGPHTLGKTPQASESREILEWAESAGTAQGRPATARVPPAWGSGRIRPTPLTPPGRGRGTGQDARGNDSYGGPPHTPANGPAARRVGRRAVRRAMRRGARCRRR
jgi:hypothetical protein